MSLVCARVRLVCLGWWRFIGGQFSEVTQHYRWRLAFHIKQNSLDIFNGESLSKLSISPYSLSMAHPTPPTPTLKVPYIIKQSTLKTTLFMKYSLCFEIPATFTKCRMQLYMMHVISANHST